MGGMVLLLLGQSLSSFIKWRVQLTQGDNSGAISSPEPSDLMAAHDPKALGNSEEP